MTTILPSLILEGLKAIHHAGKFSAFIRGVSVTLPTGEELFLKITQSTLIPRNQSFSFSPYTFVTEISGGGISEVGCGESDNKLVALQKSISESIERVLFRALKGSKFGTATSNGWAAHFNRGQCEHAALMELLERDAALTHWFTEAPFLEIDLESAPLWIKTWAKGPHSQSQFPNLRVLLSTLGHVPTISTLFQNQDGMGVVSHGASRSLEKSYTRALIETGKIARIVASGGYQNSSKKLFSSDIAILPTGPFEQAVTYSYHRAFPSWIFGNKISWDVTKKYWHAHHKRFQARPIRYEFHEVLKEPLSVGFCTSPDVQNLFFGRTADAIKRGVINRARLGLVESNDELNMSPHFVA